MLGYRRSLGIPCLKLYYSNSLWIEFQKISDEVWSTTITTITENWYTYFLRIWDIVCICPLISCVNIYLISQWPQNVRSQIILVFFFWCKRPSWLLSYALAHKNWSSGRRAHRNSDYLSAFTIFWRSNTIRFKCGLISCN